MNTENNIQNNCKAPAEEYTFTYTVDELKMIYGKINKMNCRQPVIMVIALVICMIIYNILDYEGFYRGLCNGLVLGMGIMYFMLFFKGFNISRKTQKESLERVSASVYNYKVFQNHMMLTIHRNNEKILEQKVYFCDINKFTDIGSYILFQHQNRLYILKKELLQNNSYFLYFANKEVLGRSSKFYDVAKTEKQSSRQIKTKTIVIDKKWNSVSIILTAASWLSLLGALFCVNLLSEHNNLFVKNMWIFALFIPVPVASLTVGIYMNRKGMSGIKNVVSGIIAGIMLFIYSLFPVFFADTIDNSPDYLYYVEEQTGVDLPEPESITTTDYTQGNQDESETYIYYLSDVYFDDETAADFEKKLAENNLWITNPPSKFEGISSPLYISGSYDYYLLFNIDNGKFNTMPKEDGTCCFINILYNADTNRMHIAEYEVDYVE